MKAITENYRSRCLMFYTMTALDTYLFDDTGQNLISLLSDRSTVDHDFISMTIQTDLEQLVSTIQRSTTGQFHQYANNWHMVYMGFGLWENGLYKGAVIIGPLLQQTIEIMDINRIKSLYNLDSHMANHLSAFYRSMPIYTEQETSYLSTMLYNIFSKPLMAFDTVHHRAEETPDITDDVDHFSAEYFKQLAFADKNYEYEKKILHAIETGNPMVLKQASEDKASFYLPSRLPNNPLRAQKNLAITLNSISVRAAIKGGLPLTLAHNMSEKNAIEIESMRSVSELQEFLENLITDYCEAVNKFNVQGLSPLIAQAVMIIREEVYVTLHLSDIANRVHVSPEHLSRQFKKETGKTITDFVHRVKCEEAVVMMAQEKLILSDIASQLGYSSSAYFSVIFKRQMGTSPSQYTAIDGKKNT